MRIPLWELSTAHDYDKRQHNHSTGNVRNDSVLNHSDSKDDFFLYLY
jgi:hypothetical protein